MVFGSYYTCNKTTYCFKEDYDSDPNNTEHYILFDRMTDWGLPNQQLIVDVYSESVGQYIEIRDKHNVEIYEGDIILINDEYIYIVINNTECTSIDGKDTIDLKYTEPINSIEIIGNIHDNSEFLKS